MAKPPTNHGKQWTPADVKPTNQSPYNRRKP